MFASKVRLSMKTLASDVQASRKWLDAAKSQRDKQPDNYAIHVSFQKYDSFYAITAEFFVLCLCQFLGLSGIYYPALAGNYVFII